MHRLRNSEAELLTCVQCIKVICTDIDPVVESRLAVPNLLIGGQLQWSFVISHLAPKLIDRFKSNSQPS